MLRLPRLRLGDWPTDVVRLQRLGERLGCELWAKRDDRSGRPYGGNKLRKLELLLARARGEHAETLVTVGGFGSSQVAATAVYGARAGFRTHALVFPQPATPAARQNLMVAALAGAELSTCASRAHLPFALGQLLVHAPRPYLLGPGGSSPLGAVGYVLAALELKQQILCDELPSPREIVVPLGSGGTAAGLIVGCALARIRTRVLAVRVVEKPLCNKILLRILVERTSLLLRELGQDVPRAGDFLVIDGHAGPSYGVVTAGASLAADLVRETEGLELDPTYSAKAMAALVARCRARPLAGPVLFWLTASSRLLDAAQQSAALERLPRALAAWARGAEVRRESMPNRMR